MPDSLEDQVTQLIAKRSGMPPQQYHRGLAKAVLELVTPIIREKTRLEGWVPFGTHAYDSPRPQLEFSADKDEDMFPRWERVLSEDPKPVSVALTDNVTGEVYEDLFIYDASGGEVYDDETS